jgi:arsenate reductase
MISMPRTQTAPKAKLKILFLCTGNSCRSQMAECWARQFHSSLLEPYSAGIEARGLDPRAVTVMAEAGVDLSTQQSKTIEQLAQRQFDVVVTVCDDAHERCPVLPGSARRVHVAFDDPPRLARSAATEQEALAQYRRVRDEIRAFVQRLPQTLH